MIEKDKLKDPNYLKQVLDTLREHFGEPCVPVSKYCKALETWVGIRAEHDVGFAKMWRFLYIDIVKSCLLDRLIYCGEELRKEKCLQHKGFWSGLAGLKKENCECASSCGCLTGWLPNK